MRMLIMNHVKKSQQVSGLITQMRDMSIDTLVILSGEQSIQSGFPERLLDVSLAQDGISRLYGDNLLVKLQEAYLDKGVHWQLGWATHTITANTHYGIGYLTRDKSGKHWRRMIGPNVQIEVLDIGANVLCFILVKQVKFVRRAMIQKIHDLLKAQVKPVILFVPDVFSSDLTKWGWLNRELFTQQADYLEWDYDVLCDHSKVIRVMQSCVLPNKQQGLLFDFK